MLVFTKSVDSNYFCTFWLTPVTGNILGIFTVLGRDSKWLLAHNSFERWNFSSKWSSCTNKYQEIDKIWLVSVYWLVEKMFLLNLQQNKKKWSLKNCLLKCKQILSKWITRFIYKKFLFHFYPTDLVNTRKLSPSGLVRIHSTRYMVPQCFSSQYISTTIHLPFGG